jgi:hypothetical protein
MPYELYKAAITNKSRIPNKKGKGQIGFDCKFNKPWIVKNGEWASIGSSMSCSSKDTNVHAISR